MAFSRPPVVAANAAFGPIGNDAWTRGFGVSDATSGGIPYFDSTTSEASSALLASGGVVLGGGAGGAPNTSANLTWAAATGQGLAMVAGTATTDVAAMSLTRTNNNAAVATGVKWTFTDTTSAAGFLPFQILGGAAGTTNLMSLSKDGNAVFGIDVTATNLYGTNSVSVGTSSSYGVINGAGFRTFAGGIVGISSAADNSAASDVAFSRISAGVMAVGTGSAGNSAGSLRGKFQSSDGTAGVATFGPAAVASITVKDGIITAIS